MTRSATVEEALLLRIRECLARIRELESLTLAQAERIADQSELLSRRAERDARKEPTMIDEPTRPPVPS